VTIGNSDDLGPFAPARGTDREAPFFAPVKEASMKASSTRSLPRACSSSAITRRIRSSLSFRTHFKPPLHLPPIDSLPRSENQDERNRQTIGANAGYAVMGNAA
jgi:hypothetical protein